MYLYEGAKLVSLSSISDLDIISKLCYKDRFRYVCTNQVKPNFTLDLVGVEITPTKVNQTRQERNDKTKKNVNQEKKCQSPT